MDVDEQDPRWVTELPARDIMGIAEHDGMFLTYAIYLPGQNNEIGICMGPVCGGRVFWMIQTQGQTADVNTIHQHIRDYFTDALSTPDRSVERALQLTIARLEQFFLYNVEFDPSETLQIAMMYIRRQEVWVANVGSVQIALCNNTFNTEGEPHPGEPEIITELHTPANPDEASRIDEHLDISLRESEGLTRVIGLRACKEKNIGIIAEPFVKKLSLDLDRSNVRFLIGTSRVWEILCSEKIKYSNIMTRSNIAVSCGEILDALIAAHPESKLNAQRIFRCEKCHAKLLDVECLDHQHGEPSRSLYDLDFFGQGLGMAILSNN